jgi:hypothetical protein
MSEVRVNKLSPRSGTTVTLGDSGDTISIPSGVTLSNAGTNTFASATITGDLTVDNYTLYVDSTNNRVGMLEASPQTTLHVDGTGALFDGMSIDTNIGNVTSSFSRQNNGFNYRVTEGLNVTTNSNTSASFNRKSDGRILDFYKNDTRKGQIQIDDNGISITLGGTGTANKLDDYEEGTWTPTASQGSVSHVAGGYIKIGRLVTLTIDLSNFTNTTSTDNIQINGIPFAVDSSENMATGAMFGERIDTNNNGNSVQAVLTTSSTGILFFNGVGSTNFAQLKYTDINDGTDCAIRGTITYLAAS